MRFFGANFPCLPDSARPGAPMFRPGSPIYIIIIRDSPVGCRQLQAPERSPGPYGHTTGAALSWISIGYSGGGENRRDGKGGGGLSGGTGIVHRRVGDAMRQGSQLKCLQHRDDRIGHGQRRQGRQIECRQMFNHNVLLIFPGVCSCSGFF